MALESRTRRQREHFTGCLLRGAVGDALGAPVEFLRLDEIRARYGSDGITDYDLAYDRYGAITDDTQMALFTAEGVLRAEVRSYHKGICHRGSVIITHMSGGCIRRENEAVRPFRRTGWTDG